MIKLVFKLLFEATGHYSLNLEHFLIDNGLTFMKINPLLIKNFLSSKNLRRTKTDKADAISIASY